MNKERAYELVQSFIKEIERNSGKPDIIDEIKNDEIKHLLAKLDDKKTLEYLHDEFKKFIQSNPNHIILQSDKNCFNDILNHIIDRRKEIDKKFAKSLLSETASNASEKSIVETKKESQPKSRVKRTGGRYEVSEEQAAKADWARSQVVEGKPDLETGESSSAAATKVVQNVRTERKGLKAIFGKFVKAKTEGQKSEQMSYLITSLDSASRSVDEVSTAAASDRSVIFELEGLGNDVETITPTLQKVDMEDKSLKSRALKSLSNLAESIRKKLDFSFSAKIVKMVTEFSARVYDSKTAATDRTNDRNAIISEITQSKNLKSLESAKKQLINALGDHNFRSEADSIIGIIDNKIAQLKARQPKAIPPQGSRKSVDSSATTQWNFELRLIEMTNKLSDAFKRSDARAILSNDKGIQDLVSSISDPNIIRDALDTLETTFKETLFKGTVDRVKALIKPKMEALDTQLKSKADQDLKLQTSVEAVISLLEEKPKKDKYNLFAASILKMVKDFYKEDPRKLLKKIEGKIMNSKNFEDVRSAYNLLKQQTNLPKGATGIMGKLDMKMKQLESEQTKQQEKQNEKGKSLKGQGPLSSLAKAFEKHPETQSEKIIALAKELSFLEGTSQKEGVTVRRPEYETKYASLQTLIQSSSDDELKKATRILERVAKSIITPRGFNKVTFVSTVKDVLEAIKTPPAVQRNV